MMGNVTQISGWFWRITAGLLAIVLLAACGMEMPGAQPEAEEFSGEPTALDVCVSSSSVNGAPPYYALENGIFDKYGLDVNLLDTDGGVDAARVLLAGEADLCLISGPAIVNARLAGAEISLIAGLLNRQLYSFVVGPDIETADDLRGKALAVSEPGTASDSILRYGLEQLGLNPDTDVTIVSVGGNAERLAAVEGGSAAGTVINAPFSGMARDLGYRIMLSPEDMNVPHQHTAVATSDEFLAENRDTAVRFVKALSEAVAQMQQDREGSQSLIARQFLLEEGDSQGVLDEAFEVVIVQNMDPRLQPNAEGIQRLIDEGKVDNPNALDLSPDDIIDLSILQELEQSGFFEQLESR